jgi:integrase
MASITHQENGCKRIQFTAPSGKRKTLYLGKVSKRDAQSLRLRVESLLSARVQRKEPDRDTAFWLSEIDIGLRSKLEAVDLIDPLEPKTKAQTLSAFLEHFMTTNGTDKKPATRIVWGQVINSLKDYMPDGIHLDEVTAGHAIGYAQHLKTKKLAQSTIYKRVQFARQFFGFAVNWEMIEKNPFDAKEVKSKVRRPSSKAKSNVEVPIATITTVLAFCDPVWKGIISLSRFGGLRCPSEVLTLRWGNVSFQANTLTIKAPKNEHHPGEGIRVCPLFSELRPSLEALYALAGNPTPEDYVINKESYRAAANTGRGWANANLRTQFVKILTRAKVKPWKRLFHSMRASRQTELEERFPLHVVCGWLGNSEEVARESYLLTSEAHFQAATGVSEATQNATQPTPERNVNATHKATSRASASASVASQSTNEKTGEARAIPLLSPVYDHSDEWRRRELNIHQIPRELMDIQRGNAAGNANENQLVAVWEQAGEQLDEMHLQIFRRMTHRQQTALLEELRK